MVKRGSARGDLTMMPTEWLRVREGNPERREKYIYFLPPGLPKCIS
jgi:hypothetical protein